MAVIPWRYNIKLTVEVVDTEQPIDEEENYLLETFGVGIHAWIDKEDLVNYLQKMNWVGLLADLDVDDLMEKINLDDAQRRESLVHGWMTNRDPYTTCSICGEPFTDEQWQDRHTDDEGEDCHEGCCPICPEEKE